MSYSINTTIAPDDDAQTELEGAAKFELDTFEVNISGHANIDHGPSDEWAEEFLTVSIHVHPPEASDGA